MLMWCRLNWLLVFVFVFCFSMSDLERANRRRKSKVTECCRWELDHPASRNTSIFSRSLNSPLIYWWVSVEFDAVFIQWIDCAINRFVAIGFSLSYKIDSNDKCFLIYSIDGCDRFVLGLLKLFPADFNYGCLCRRNWSRTSTTRTHLNWSTFCSLRWRWLWRRQTRPTPHPTCLRASSRRCSVTTPSNCSRIAYPAKKRNCGTRSAMPGTPPSIPSSANNTAHFSLAKLFNWNGEVMAWIESSSRKLFQFPSSIQKGLFEKKKIITTALIKVRWR